MAGDLTIIIVTWNTRNLTRGCLASMEKVDPRHAWKVVVVDNASTDGTPEMVREAFPWVRLRCNDRNLGFGRAHNLILRETNSEFVLLLNSDILLLDGSVPELLKFMKTHPDVGLAGGQLIYPDGRLQNSIAFFPTLLTELTNKSLMQILFPKRFPGKRQRFTSPVEVDSVIGAAMMLRTEALRSVGYFDEGYFFFLEETDLCLRLKRQGWKVYFLPHVKIVHLQGRSVRQVKPRARVEYQRSLVRFFEKTYGPAAGWMIRWYGYFKAWAGLLGALPERLISPRACPSWVKYRYLLTWYHRGCPKHMGLNPGG